MCEICEIRENPSYPCFRVAQGKGGGWLQAACRDVAIDYAKSLGIDPATITLEPYNPDEDATKYAESYKAIRKAQDDYEAAHFETVDFSSALKAWRGCAPDKPRGTITQREAADRLGIGYDTLRRIEAGGTFPYPKLLLLALKSFKP